MIALQQNQSDHYGMVVVPQWRKTCFTFYSILKKCWDMSKHLWYEIWPNLISLFLSVSELMMTIIACEKNILLSTMCFSFLRSCCLVSYSLCFSPLFLLYLTSLFSHFSFHSQKQQSPPFSSLLSSFVKAEQGLRSTSEARKNKRGFQKNHFT